MVAVVSVWSNVAFWGARVPFLEHVELKGLKYAIWGGGRIKT
jgi:hypothetical protein